MFGLRLGARLLLTRLRGFVFVTLGASVGVALNVTKEPWVVSTVAVLAVVFGWIMFKQIWSKHGDGKDAFLEIWRIERWLIVIGIVAGLLLWVRHG